MCWDDTPKEVLPYPRFMSYMFMQMEFVCLYSNPDPNNHSLLPSWRSGHLNKVGGNVRLVLNQSYCLLGSRFASIKMICSCNRIGADFTTSGRQFLLLPIDCIPCAGAHKNVNAVCNFNGAVVKRDRWLFCN